MRLSEYALALAVVLAPMMACGGVDNGDADDDGDAQGNTSTGTETGTGTSTGTDTGTSTGTETGSGGASCDWASMRADTLENGTALYDGVSLTESTPIADILADLDGYQGQLVQIEGLVVEVCASQGCYVKLVDADQNALNLKVIDGAIDFRDSFPEGDVAGEDYDPSLGRYAVGDGIVDKAGEHGAQVFIQDHGAMVAPSTCPQPWL